MPAEPVSTAAQERILGVLQGGPATLAGIRRAFPSGDTFAQALPSMGEEDPLGEELTALVLRGTVLDEDGRYRLAAG